MQKNLREIIIIRRVHYSGVSTTLTFASSGRKMSFSCKPIQDVKLEQIFGIKNLFSEYHPGKCTMLPQLSKIAQEILDFKVKKDDVWMISFPRTGSTWCQEMVWLIGNDLNFKEAKETIQQIRAPVLELSAVFTLDEYGEYMKNYGNSVERVKNHPSPRFIKSHLPWTLLPTELDQVKPKIIYVARNPKDMCVSYYHHFQQFYDIKCSFEEFSDLLLNDKLPFCPLWSHYLGFWNKSHEENVLFLKYEDMKEDLKDIIRKISKFLDKPLTEDKIDLLYDYLSFTNMKNNKSVNMEPVLRSRTGKYTEKISSQDFIRNGKVGDWKTHMSMELTRKFDDWIEENTKGTGLQF